MAQALKKTWQQVVGEKLARARGNQRLADVAFDVRIVLERKGYTPIECPSGDVIGRYERGEKKSIPHHHAVALAEVLHLDIADLEPSTASSWVSASASDQPFPVGLAAAVV